MIDSQDQEIFALHEGGKITVNSKITELTYDDLAKVYTPGVAKVCQAIAHDPSLSHKYTIRKNTVAVLSNGTAVLGLGNIGPLAAMPVMEGKAMLFKMLAGVDAFPICIDAHTVDEVIAIAKALEPTFGGFNLEDISAPSCFEIERRLQEAVQVPVFHDDQHGTAVVTLAALINSLKLVGKQAQNVCVVVSGAGAAAIACSKIFIQAGIGDIILCDRHGAIYAGRTENMNASKEEIALISNKNKFQGTLQEALRGADVFMGLSGPNLLTRANILTMADRAIVFAMSNPVPEIDPHSIQDVAAVIATGRSDFPNQINNVLCFPGFFRGLLDGGAKRVEEGMKVAAAEAIASLVSGFELRADYIIPAALDPRVAPAVAEAVRKLCPK